MRLGYRPNRALGASRSSAVTVVIAEKARETYALIARRLEEATRA